MVFGESYFFKPCIGVFYNSNIFILVIGGVNKSLPTLF